MRLLSIFKINDSEYLFIRGIPVGLAVKLLFTIIIIIIKGLIIMKYEI